MSVAPPAPQTKRASPAQEIKPGPLGDTGVGDGPPPSAKEKRAAQQGSPDAPLQVVAVRPEDVAYEALTRLALDPEDAAAAKVGGHGSPYEHLDTKSFVESERVKALKPYGPQLRVRVTVGDALLELPHDSPDDLRAFIEDLYLFRGWPGIQLVREELRLMVIITGLLDRIRSAHPSRRSPLAQGDIRSPVSGSRSRDLELAARIGDANYAQASVWQQSFDDMLKAFSSGLLEVMQKFEVAVSKRARERLEMHRESIKIQTASYFWWHDPGKAEGELAALQTPADMAVSDAFVQELRAHLSILAPLAEVVVTTETKSRTAEEIWRMAAYRGHADDPAVKKAKDDAQAELDKARAALAVAISTAAAKHPVLFRFNPSEIVAAAKGTPTHLGGAVFSRLQQSWKAAGAIHNNLFAHRPASDLRADQITAGVAPEELITENAEHSVWAYRKLVDEGLASCDPHAADFLKRAAVNVTAAREAKEAEEATIDVLETVGIVALTVALHATCPPLGLALDIATSASDVYRTTSLFEEQRDEAWCYLNPRDCLTDDPPTRWGQALAIVGAVMTVAA